MSLEDPDIRSLAVLDPRGFLATYHSPVIFDEIQRVPSLLSYIQTIVDERPGNGQFVLTGSHQLALSQAITQSLAGRTALLTLYPLSISELLDAMEGRNIFAERMHTVRHASLGDIAETLYQVGGRYRRST